LTDELTGSVAEVCGTRRRAARLRIERVVLPRERCCMHWIAHQAWRSTVRWPWRT